jgi:hypothetical protein
MNLDALLRAAQILRAQPAYAMPVARLHACLREELGDDAGTCGQMLAALKKRPHSFMILDEPRFLEDHAYMQLGDAALGACSRVALTEVSDPADALGLAGATLGELWPASVGDPVLKEMLMEAARELDAVSALVASAPARPTTLPPGPRRAP